MPVAPYREDPTPTDPVWCVLTEPSMFRAGESRVRGPFDERTAKDFAHRWVRLNPHGEARCVRVRHWPPALNWQPRPRYDDATTDVYCE